MKTATGRAEATQVGLLGNTRRTQLRSALSDQAIRAAAQRIAEPELHSPTLVVAAFQSSI